MDVTFVQTSDALFYYPMLAETSRTIRRYCINKGLAYEQYVGLKRGRLPWNAAYNRVYMLKEMLDRGVEGWVYYLDADAMIIDQDFDIRTYLQNRNHHGAIFAGYCTPGKKYDVNSGGFAVNLSHPWGRTVVLDYWRAVEAIPDAAFDAALVWEKDIPEDQYLLYRILEDYVLDKRCEDAFLFEQANEGYTNQGPFISQRLRSSYPDFASRMTAIRSEVARILDDREDDRIEMGAGFYVPTGHPSISTGCGTKALSAIRSTGAGGMLVYGPYVDLAAGSYTMRIYGDATAAGGEPVALTSDVASDMGTVVWTPSVPASPVRKGLLVEHRVTLDRDAKRVEVRLTIDPGADVVAHAIHIVRTA